MSQSVGTSRRSWRWFGRYTIGARAYDVLSLEWPVYGAGRRAGVELLALRPGDRVLDVGCGTGLSLGLLVAAVGPTGEVVGVDASPTMLTRARARVRRHGWANVRLVQADAGAGDPICTGMDAVLFTYSLSIIGDWQAAGRSALAALRPGGRVAVVDLAVPRRWWAPLAWLMCATGGVHPKRRVWELVAVGTTDYKQRVLRAGHIRVAAGSLPDGRPR